MSGNGVKIGLGIIHTAMLQILMALLQARIASCVAVPGAITRGSFDPPSAAGSILAAGAAASGSVLCRPGEFTPFKRAACLQARAIYFCVTMAEKTGPDSLTLTYDLLKWSIPAIKGFPRDQRFMPSFPRSSVGMHTE